MGPDEFQGEHANGSGRCEGVNTATAAGNVAVRVLDGVGGVATVLQKKATKELFPNHAPNGTICALKVNLHQKKFFGVKSGQ